MLGIVISLALVLAVAALAIVLIASRRPDTFQLSRSVTIAAPPEAIFPLINDLKAFATWSPFEKDPAMKRVYSGPDSGEGQRYDFDGDRNVGKGSVLITRSQPPSRVEMQLLMLAPMKADNHVTFTFVPQGADTVVTWAMDGRVGLAGKVLHTFMDMGKMCGDEFEKGLATLKSRVEKQPSLAAHG